MAFLLEPESTDEFQRGPNLYIRVTGFIIAFFAGVFLIGHTANVLRDDPFHGQRLGLTKAVITTITPGVSQERFRATKGYYFHYRFILHDEPYTGQFFVFSQRYYQVGHEVDVEYCVNQPGLNRWKSNTRGDEPPAIMNAMGLVFLCIYAAVAVLGFVMVYTGKVPLKRSPPTHQT